MWICQVSCWKLPWVRLADDGETIVETGMAHRLPFSAHRFPMSSDHTPLEPEQLEKDNQQAINKIRALAPDLWAVEEHEREILSSNKIPMAYAIPAEPGKS